MLIDDDPDDHEMFAEALHDVSSEHHCRIARTAGEALEMLRMEKLLIPNYIFLDINMPADSGSYCISEIKQMEHVRSVPVIIYSTSSQQEDVLKAHQLGAAHYFVKPCSFNILSVTLAKILNKHTLPFLLP